MNKNYILSYKKALNNFIDLSSKDSTSYLVKERGLIGLTRLLICMEELGIENGAKLIALPDFTYTRNQLRWDAGFPYGCIVKINNPYNNFIPLEFRPNCCGVVFGEIPNKDYDFNVLKNRLINFINKSHYIDSNDFNKRNHFIGIYINPETGKYYALLHGSFKYVKNNLYSERKNKWSNKIQKKDILNKEILYLYGHDAIEYYNDYKIYENESSKLRLDIMNYLFFNEFKVLFNETHEGFRDINTILLGAYSSNTSFQCPIMLSADEDLYYINVNKPLSNIDDNFYCAPHGGGYRLSSIVNAKQLNHDEFILTYPNKSIMITNNIIDLPFNYRKNTISLWCDKYEFGESILKLKPILNLKI